MSALLAALWGLVGGLCVDGLELHGRIRRTPGGKLRQAIKDPLAYILAVAIRAGVGAAVAGAAAASGRVPDAFVALAFGVAAPLVIVMLTRAVQLDRLDDHVPTVRTAQDQEAVDGTVPGSAAPKPLATSGTDSHAGAPTAGGAGSGDDDAG